MPRDVKRALPSHSDDLFKTRAQNQNQVVSSSLGPALRHFCRTAGQQRGEGSPLTRAALREACARRREQEEADEESSGHVLIGDGQVGPLAGARVLAPVVRSSLTI